MLSIESYCFGTVINTTEEAPLVDFIVTDAAVNLTTMAPAFVKEEGPMNQPNTALFCTILALGTFFIAYYLREFRNSKFLGRTVSILILRG